MNRHGSCRRKPIEAADSAHGNPLDQVDSAGINKELDRHPRERRDPAIAWSVYSVDCVCCVICVDGVYCVNGVHCVGACERSAKSGTGKIVYSVYLVDSVCLVECANGETGSCLFGLFKSVWSSAAG